MKRVLATLALGAGLSAGAALISFAEPSRIVPVNEWSPTYTVVPRATGSNVATGSNGLASDSNGRRSGGGGSGSGSGSGSSSRKSAGSSTNTSVGTWQKDARGWWLSYGSVGNYARNTWVLKDSKWYHFNSEGYMETSWRNIGGTWYYLHDDGHMNTGWLLTPSNGKWYYFDNSGAMWANTTTPDGYTVNANGEYVAK